MNSLLGLSSTITPKNLKGKELIPQAKKEEAAFKLQSQILKWKMLLLKKLTLKPENRSKLL